MKYYVKRKGKTYGPVEEAKIRNYVNAGFFSESCMGSEDLQTWVPLQQCLASRHPVLQIVGPGKSEVPPPRPIRLTASDLTGRENDHAAPNASSSSSSSSSSAWLGIAVLLVLLLIGGGMLAFYFSRDEESSSDFSSEKTNRSTRSERKSRRSRKHNAGQDAPTNFQEVCQRYQSAVGVVVVTLEDSNGKLMTNVGEYPVASDQPIGTAFAISENKFVTNSHVAYGVKDQKNGVLEEILARIVISCAQKDGIKNKEELARYCKRNEQDIKEARKFLRNNIRVRSVEIRLAHSNGRSLQVTGVQVHPRYKANTKGNETYKNGEFDLAILTTAETTETVFPIASSETLYSLSAGQDIGYMGFPMEGLLDQGDLDLNHPEAVLKTGMINKITDFNNVFSRPELNRSIIHDLPTVGGASGSPIFTKNGEIVAILWGGNNHGSDASGARIGSAAQHNFATRIDSLEAVKTQPEHPIREWLGEGKK